MATYHLWSTSLYSFKRKETISRFGRVAKARDWPLTLIEAERQDQAKDWNKTQKKDWLERGTSAQWLNTTKCWFNDSYSLDFQDDTFIWNESLNHWAVVRIKFDILTYASRGSIRSDRARVRSGWPRRSRSGDCLRQQKQYRSSELIMLLERLLTKGGTRAFFRRLEAGLPLSWPPGSARCCRPGAPRSCCFDPSTQVPPSSEG